MKAITHEWLDRAQDDLNAAHALLNYPDLTHPVDRIGRACGHLWRWEQCHLRKSWLCRN